MSELTTLAERRTSQTRRLLACGIVAGPLFLAVSLVQAFTRRGFDLGRHPISLLSLGDLGWLQITNFVVTGALYLACASGLRRVLQPGRGAAWGPRLVGALGVGLIVAGVFVADAGAGYPPGAPEGAPPKISWHGMLHEVGFLVANLGMIAGCIVFARRFAALKQPAWVAASIVTPVAVLSLSFWPDQSSLSVRLVIATAILFGYVAAVATRALGSVHDRGRLPDIGVVVDLAQQEIGDVGTRDAGNHPYRPDTSTKSIGATARPVGEPRRPDDHPVE